MKKSQSVSEALQALQTKGYQLADAPSEQPDGPAQPFDWKLDAVHPVVHEEGRYALLVAVSSASRNRKLLFLESAPSQASFSPMALLRKLFPKR